MMMHASTFTHRSLLCFTALCLVYVFYLFALPNTAMAVHPASIGNFDYVDTNGELTECKGEFKKYQVVAKVVTCFKYAVKAGTVRFLRPFSDYMWYTIVAFMTLTTALFGVRLLSGEGEMHKKAITYAIKFGAVIGFTYDLGGLSQVIFDVMEEAIALVSKGAFAILAAGGGSDSAGQCVGQQVDASYDASFVWYAMDCLLAVIFGYAGQTFLPLSLVSIATTAVWSGAAGGMLFFTVLGVFISLIFLVFRTVYVFLTAYLTVGFLVIISPMFIPLILIQSTEQFFNKWLENLIGAMLSPLMMFTFIGFALFLIDHVIFSGDNSLTAIIQDDIWEALKDEAPICNWQMQFDPEAMQQDATGVKSALAPFISGAMNLCSVIMFPSLDMGEEHNQRMWEIMIAVLKILAVVYVANQIMETLPNMMGQVFRAGGATVAGAVSGPVPGRQLVDQGVATVRSGAENFFSRALGR